MSRGQAFVFQDTAGLKDEAIRLDLFEAIPADHSKWELPAYRFWIRGVADDVKLGYISLRVGENWITQYTGHIGCEVEEPYRGRRLAGRATRMVMGFAAAHGMERVRLTANPENRSSRRAIEALGGVFREILELPPAHYAYQKGERRKAVYEIATGEKKLSMAGMELIRPTQDYLESFRRACVEYKAHGVTAPYIFDPDEYDGWKGNILSDWEAHSRGENLPEGWVPTTTLWLVEGTEYIATGNLRHRLNPKLERWGGHIGYCVRPSRWGMGYGTRLLGLTLARARELGIGPALLTCDDGNISSIQVIERNGGKLQDRLERPDGDRVALTRRYWVPTGENG